MAGVMQITLERDGHDQPWGFRLQGGADIGSPLLVQRVLVATPADGFLRKGDEILAVGGVDVKKMSHQEVADMFTNAGNPTTVSVRRTATAPATSKTTKFSSSTTTQSIISSVKTHEHNRLLNTLSRSATLPKNFPTPRTLQKSTTYGTLPMQRQQPESVVIVQPSARLLAHLGPGSASHLKKQIDRMGGYRAYDPVTVKANVKGGGAGLHRQNQVYQPIHQDLILPSPYTKARVFAPTNGWQPNKVIGNLQQVHNKPIPSFPVSVDSSPVPPAASNLFAPCPVPAAAMKKSQPISYNCPINLYSAENVADVSRLNQEAKSPIPSTNRQITPNKPQQVILNPAKDFNPQESATWKALQESSDTPLMDPAKMQGFTNLKEHDPIFSSVYANRKPSPNMAQQGLASSPQPGSNQLPVSPARSPLPGRMANCRSPVADLLPASYAAAKAPVQPPPQQQPTQESAVMQAAHEDPSSSPSFMPSDERVPVYETNAIGGKKRITQSASFNKLMMDVLGL